MLTTLANVKLLLNITDGSQDALLTYLINAVSAWIETYCGRTFLKPANEITELYDGTGKKMIIVKNYPVDSLSKIEERTDAVTFVEIAVTKYYTDKEAGIVETDFFTTIGNNNYQITYKGGYATVPVDLDMACAQMVANEFYQRQTGGGGGEVSSESLGEYSVSYNYKSAETETDKFIDNTLSRYKRYRV